METKAVESIQFGILSPDEIRRFSVCEIKSALSYEAGKPVKDGLSDLRLGTIDRGVRCTTDDADHISCPGYFGHLELARPVFHHGFLKTVLGVLRCVGYSSSKILLKSDDPDYIRSSSLCFTVST